MHEHEVECHHEAKPLNSAKSSNSSHNTYNSSSTAHIPPAFPLSLSTVLPAGKPIEIYAMKTGKPHGLLTPEEHQHYKDLKLCLYYGRPNHDAKSCPNMPKAAKKCFTSKQANPLRKA